MLNVAHVKNIVTKFGTLIENMSRTGLYDCHIFSSNVLRGSGAFQMSTLPSSASASASASTLVGGGGGGGQSQECFSNFFSFLV